MRSSKAKPKTAKQDFIQLGLDFFEENQYIIEPLRVEDTVNNDLLAQLDEKISVAVQRFTELTKEKQELIQENQRLKEQHAQLAARVDAMLQKLDTL